MDNNSRGSYTCVYFPARECCDWFLHLFIAVETGFISEFNDMVAKSESGGPSLLTRTKAGNCAPMDPTQTAPLAPDQKPWCGSARMTTNTHRITFEMVGGSMTQFAQNIGGRLSRPVVDKTGIAERFDIHLEFAPAGADLSDELVAPSIFTALGQLGLKLTAAKGPRDFLVIDRVERPSKN